MAGRYQPEGPEAEFEVGSRGRVLRNRLGIKSVRQIQGKESEALLAAAEQFVDETLLDHQFTPDDIRRMHRVWLGEIYEWAGKYRQVNMTKSGFMFAAANQIPRLMDEFGRGPLRDYTPCMFGKQEEIATALAVVHAEFILIHPFREGNGRCGRLLAILMGLQSGLPALDFGAIQGAKKNEYIAAIHAALGRDYAPMSKIFRDVIARTTKVRRR
jgi:cell filamentation protein